MSHWQLKVWAGPVVLDPHYFAVLFGEPADGLAFHGRFNRVDYVFEEDVVFVTDVT